MKDRPRWAIRATAIGAGTVLAAALAALVILSLLDMRAEITATREVVSQQRDLLECLADDSHYGVAAAAAAQPGRQSDAEPCPAR